MYRMPPLETTHGPGAYLAALLRNRRGEEEESIPVPVYCCGSVHIIRTVVAAGCATTISSWLRSFATIRICLVVSIVCRTKEEKVTPEATPRVDHLRWLHHWWPQHLCNSPILVTKNMSKFFTFCIPFASWHHSFKICLTWNNKGATIENSNVMM